MVWAPLSTHTDTLPCSCYGYCCFLCSCYLLMTERVDADVLALHNQEKMIRKASQPWLRTKVVIFSHKKFCLCRSCLKFTFVSQESVRFVTFLYTAQFTQSFDCFPAFTNYSVSIDGVTYKPAFQLEQKSTCVFIRRKWQQWSCMCWLSTCVEDSCKDKIHFCIVLLKDIVLFCLASKSQAFLTGFILLYLYCSHRVSDTWYCSLNDMARHVWGTQNEMN